MRFHVISIFPQMIKEAMGYGVVGQALTKKLFSIDFINPRDFTSDFHKTVDDRPYGGGDGMIMLYEPLKKAVQSLGDQAGRRVLLSATGRKWNDSLAREYANQGGDITLVCGRYGGVDQRFVNEFIDEDVSVGDFILSGGEIAAVAMLDSIVRLRPDVLGNKISAHQDSFAEGLLEAPLFTRPAQVDGQSVPAVFIGGDHKKIDDMRRALQLALTCKKRPDLFASFLNSQEMRDHLQRAVKTLKTLSDSEIKMCGLNTADILRLDSIEQIKLGQHGN